ncbi:hypothetical protein NHX12_017011 [Muraenolepis orangiensis]|uniref:Uncharacterized protein n=1 Tax=Muraenolepis orangiensis TaxID=630683 RepID=A0A9Q0D6K2_9TELE|nr:hypothetical protein NHX12_017011 [Muraenolepis orangiensis]
MMAEGPHSEGGPLRPQHTGDAREVNDTHTPSRAKSPGSQEPSTHEERPRPQQGEVEAPGSDGVRGPPTAPDGGWGWAVLLATVLVMALTLSFSSCVGVFYTDLQAEFSASNTQTSWVPAIMIAVLHAGGKDLC